MAKYKVQKKPRKSKSEGKYAHKKTVVDGITFDSKMEANYYEHLKQQKARGYITDIELQPVYVLQPRYFVIDNTFVSDDSHQWDTLDKRRKAFNKTASKEDKVSIVQSIKYIADFKVTYADGHELVIDVKGVKTPDFKLKEKMFNFRYPHSPLVCITWDGPTKQWVTYEIHNDLKKERKKKK